MRNRSLILSALALALVATPTFAAEGAATKPSHGGEKAFARIDTDSDGKISKTEFDAFIAKQSERRQEGGKPAKERKNGGPEARGDAIFAKLDADKDGSLSPEEFAKLAEVRKEHAGKDRPGKADGAKGKRREKPNA